MISTCHTWIFVAISIMLVSGCEGGPPSPHPNIIYILADDMGYGDVGALNENSGIPTPHIDRIAREGMIFSDAHTSSSVCTPTRYGILTGRYAWRTYLKNGVLQGHSEHLINPAEIQLFDMDHDPSETTNIQHLHPGVVHRLKKLLAGYIVNGRSNEGPAVYNDPYTSWPQIEILDESIEQE